jgi:hypothetical protein
MIRHDGWSHMIVTLNDLPVNLVVMHYFISYRDSSIIYCIDKAVTSFAKVDTNTKAEDEGGRAKEIGLGRKVLPRQQFSKLLPRQCFWLKFHKDDELFSKRRGYTISCYYELPEMSILFITPF